MQLSAASLVYRFPGAARDGMPAVDVEELSVRAGGLSVLTGPSGSGKSTLLYLLSGLVKPDTGSIRAAGEDLARLGEGARDQWRRRNVGMVFQNFHLIPEMTALQNVVVAAYFGHWSARKVEGQARHLLERFGIAEHHRRADTYSRGEQQRIALARALVFDPPAIFADEPTASLDLASAQSIAIELKRLARDEGKLVLAVSHDEALIGRADTLIRLDHGRLGADPIAENAA